MSKVSSYTIILSIAALCSLSTAASDADDIYRDKENVLQANEFSNEEVKESKLITKCYDEETKSAYKVDSVWYPVGKCEKRTCSRQNNSKIPIIKTIECEPCTSCKLPNQICHPFRSDKNYPKCCSQCLTKSTILMKTESKKKYQNV
ncbi:uncharacterized protein LOC132917159 [Rhopalosiphum padi]|uniref:uncharacterized protein LOC132917159 n=1 Tax=Rhopalosiphum padi TaxID=40932 RepID=UPI00298D712D|nr:uncharacterized protein LOC132917159 [Rhopalosiphum padi]